MNNSSAPPSLCYIQISPYYWYDFPAGWYCPVCRRPYDSHFVPWPGLPYSVSICTVPGA